jgi:hypothetical protein
MQVRILTKLLLVSILFVQVTAFTSGGTRKPRSSSNAKQSQSKSAENTNQLPDAQEIHYRLEYSLGGGVQEDWTLLSRVNIAFAVGKNGLDSQAVQLETASRSLDGEPSLRDAFKRNSWYRIRITSSNDSTLSAPIASARIVGLIFV